MLEQWWGTLWWLLIILVVFSVLIWKNQMIRIIIGNYILMIVALSFAGAVDMWLWWNNALATTTWSRNIWALLSDGRVTVTLIIYALLLLLIFKRSTIHSSSPGFIDKWFILLLVPMTVISMALTLGVIFLGTQVFDPSAMARLASDISTDLTVQSFVQKVPLWIFIHWLLTVLLTTHISLSYFIKKPIQLADDLLD